MLDPRVKIINQLRPTADKLIRRTLRRYENSIYAYCFNPSELNAVAEDLMIIIAEKSEQGLIDQKGIYNYFTECFTHKCQDIYHAHAKTKKRGSIEVDGKDISDCVLNDGTSDSCPELILSLRQELDSVSNYLIKYDKAKAPFSKIIELFLKGKTPLEIQSELNITASSLDRYKQQALDLLKDYPKCMDSSEFYSDGQRTQFMVNKEMEPTIKSHITREIKFTPKKDFVAKFTYYCTLEVYQENKLLKKDKIVLKQEDSFNKDNFFALQNINLKDIEWEFKQLIDVKTNELKAA